MTSALTDLDLHLFGEGNHHHIYRKLGAHRSSATACAGTRFAVWAPNAQRVSVVGDFNLWDGRRHAMQRARRLGHLGDCSFPTSARARCTSSRSSTRTASVLLKSDPYAFQMQLRPDNASIVADIGGYDWDDGEWLAQRARVGSAARADLRLRSCIRDRGVARGIASPHFSPGTSSPIS